MLELSKAQSSVPELLLLNFLNCHLKEQNGICLPHPFRFWAAVQKTSEYSESERGCREWCVSRGCLLYLPSPRSALPAPPPLPRVSLISVIDLAGDFIRILLIASKVQFLNPYKAALSSEQASERASPGLVWVPQAPLPPPTSCSPLWSFCYQHRSVINSVSVSTYG